MKRKLGILQAFQADPPLLILDEPTEGLDPLMQEAFYQLLVDVQKRGRTVFFSSHVLSEVERVCERVALLRQGELVLLSSVEECRKLAARRVRVLFGSDVPAPVGHEVIESGPRTWVLSVKGPLGPLMRELASLPVEDLQVSEVKLEDAVRHFYRGDAA
jgi:ABC-2 type transport system ATP-binding protein